MEEAGGSEPLRYGSRAGRTGFGVWCTVLLVMVVAATWEAVVTGDGPPLFAALWMAGILTFGLDSMSLELTITPSGTLMFRSLLRRRRWRAVQLRKVHAGGLCMVFRFRNGGAMLATDGRDDRWDAVLDRILELNPTVEVRGWPREAGPPSASGGSGPPRRSAP